MPVVFTCPNPVCTRTSHLPDEAAGKRVKCLACGQTSAATLTPDSTADGSPRRATPVSPVPVEKVGRFVIRGKLGEGAFGAVYRAYDPQLDREVALKVPHTAVLDSPVRVERFLREAKAAANLRHPHIVPVFDAGTDGGRHYIASAFIDGQKLADAIDVSEGGLEFDRAARLVRELAEALAYAHGQGIVHRDVKADNVMLDRSDHIHLMDFGLAVKQDAENRLTNDGAVMGTPSYMAPEQARGETAAVGPAADQYACGVVLYELLTGKTPFTGPVPVVLHNQIHTAPEPPKKHRRAIPKDLETVCLMAMNKRPEERYANCREFADDLRRWHEGEPVSVRPLNSVEKVARWVRKNRVVAGLLGAVMFSLAAGATAAGVLAIQARAASSLAEESKRNEQAQRFVAEEAQRNELAQRVVVERTLKETQESRDQLARSEQTARVANYQAYLMLARVHLQNGDAALAARALDACAEKQRGWEWRLLKRSTTIGQIVVQQVALSNAPAAAGFTPDLQRVAVIHEDGTVRVCETDTAKDVWKVQGHGRTSSANDLRLTVSQDGSRLLTIGKNQAGTGVHDALSAVVWDTASGAKVRDLDVDTEPKQAGRRYVQIALSPDGKRAAAADSFARGGLMWDVDTGKILTPFGTFATACTFTPDGQELLFHPLNSPQLMKVSRDGGAPASAWNVTSLQMTGMALSPDGSLMAGAHSDKTIRVRPVGASQDTQTLSGHVGLTHHLVIFDHNRRLASGGEDGVVKIWAIDTGAELLTLTGPGGAVVGLGISADGQSVAAAFAGGKVVRWTTTGAEPFVDLSKASNSVIALTWWPDSKQLAVAQKWGNTMRYELGRGKPPTSLSDASYLTFSPDGRQFAAGWRGTAVKGGTKAEVVICDSTTGDVVKRFGPHTGSCHSISWLRGKNWVVVRASSPGGGVPGETTIWDVDSGTEVARFRGHEGGPAALSPTDDRLAVISLSAVLLYEVNPWKRSFALSGKVQPESGTSFSRGGIDFRADGKRIVSTGYGKVAVVWDVSQQNPLFELTGHTNAVHTAVYSPDGKLIATGSEDETVRVWDADSGTVLATLSGHNAGVLAVSFSPDGKSLATGDANGGLKVWDVARVLKLTASEKK